MTPEEKNWLNNRDSFNMLLRLEKTPGVPKGPALDRRIRLYAAACCRSLWDLFSDPRSKQAIEATELFADGKLSEKRLQVAWNNARKAHDASHHYPRAPTPNRTAALAARHLSWAREFEPGWIGAGPKGESAMPSSGYGTLWHLNQAACHSGREGYRAAEWVALIHEIFGNPFRPAQPIPVEVLDANGGAVRRVAKAIYKDRSWETLCVLADALEEAGYEDAEVLRHFRSPGQHARGCWALDLCLPELSQPKVSPVTERR